MLLLTDIVHVNAIISFAAVSLQIKFTKLLLLVWHNMLMLKLALVPLQEKKKHTQNGGSQAKHNGCNAHSFSVKICLHSSIITVP